MNKIWLIAQRDFLTTISNRGFLFGLFILPLLIGVAVLVGPRLLSASALAAGRWPRRRHGSHWTGASRVAIHAVTVGHRDAPGGERQADAR